MYVLWRWSPTQTKLYCDKLIVKLDEGHLVRSKVYGICLVDAEKIVALSEVDLNNVGV